MREENGNALQYSCLENPMDRGVWWATVHEVIKESDMTEQLNNNKKEIRNDNHIRISSPNNIGCALSHV